MQTMLMQSLQTIIKKGSTDGDRDRFLVAAEVKNAANARKTLRKLAQVQGAQFKEREFQGETLYELEVPDVSEDDGTSEVGVVIAENQLMFANDVKLLEHVLRGTEGRESLAESGDYKRIASRFPENTVGSSFARDNDPLQTVRTLLKMPLLVHSPLLGGDSDSLEDKLPEPASLKKFASLAGSYVQPDERGVKIVSFTLSKSE